MKNLGLLSRSHIFNSTLQKLVVLMATIIATGVVCANPTGGVVAQGQATITQTPGSTQINQTSDKAVVNWNSFNIGQGETTHFQQPTSSSITLNRVDPGQGVSQIFGNLSANGRIIIVNQAGIYFGPTARVDVGGIMASTVDITDKNFMAGKYSFDQPSSYNGAVINRGTIIAADHGLVALIGSNVSNEGYVQANLGNVVLASGKKFTVDLKGDGLVNFVIDEASNGSAVDSDGKAMRNAVNNSGAIVANGGKILLTASTAQGVVDHVINMTGILQAHSVQQQAGEIILSSKSPGSIVVAGFIDATGKKINELGGVIKILGSNIHLQSTANLDVSGDIGGGLILVGGNFHGIGPEQNALTTIVDPGAVLNANALTYGKGGRVAVWSDLYTKFNGDISAQGGVLGGDGGYVETSGGYLSVAGAHINLLAPFGSTGIWLLDPTDVTISNSATTNESFGGGSYSPSGNTSNILASELLTNLASANVTIETSSGGGGNGDISVNTALGWSAATTLTLNAIRNIYLNADITALNGGLILTAANIAQSITSGTASSPSSTGVTANVNVKNFNLSQGQWYQSNSTLPTFYVSNNFQIASGAANPLNVQFLRASSGTGTSGSPYVLQDIYGVQGINSSSTLLADFFSLGQNISAASTSNWNSGAGFIPLGSSTAFTGGFNGGNYTINGLYINSSLSQVGLFGTVTLGSNSIQNLGVTNANITGTGANVGILVGNFNTGTISNDYTSGTVVGTLASNGTGGLVGEELSGSLSTITGSYSTASISAGVAGGGLAGYSNGIISNSWFGGSVSSTSLTGGLVGYGGVGYQISNSYNVGSVSVAGGNNDAGGLVGWSHGGATITNSYNIGSVTGTTAGGLIGSGQPAGTTIVNSFWDTETSGTNTSYSANGSTPIGVGYQGMTTAQMMTLSNFQTGSSFINGTGWSISTGSSNTWGIISAQSFPYLTAFYSSTPSAISGTAVGSSTVGNTLQLAVNGTALTTSGLIQGTTRAGANGFYYFLEPNGTISSGNTVLSYLSGASTKGNVVATAGTGGSLTNLTINAANNVDIGTTTDINSYSNSTLITALGGLSSTDILFGNPSGNNITLGNSSNTVANLNIGSSNASYTVNGTISDGTGATSTSMDFSGSVTNNGNNVTTTGAQTYSGTLTLGGSAMLTGGVISLQGITGAGYGLTINNSSTSSIAGIFSGTGGLTKSGVGILVLNSANTFSGATTINDGILQIGASNAGVANSAVTIASSGTLDLNNFNISIASIAGSGNISLGSGTLTTGSDNTNTTYSGLINDGGSGGLTKVGTGTLTLSGNNNYLGGTSVNAGIIVASNVNALGATSGGVTIASGGEVDINGVAVANAITASGGTVKGIGSASLSGNLALSGANTISTASGSDVLTVNGTIDGASNLTLAGPGKIVLAGTVGSNTPLASLISNAGTTTLSNAITTSGTQTYNNALTLNASPTLTITGTGNMFFGAGITGNANNLSLISNNSANTLTLQTGNTQNWTITAANAGTVSGILGGGTLSMNGFGNLTGGSVSDTFTINGGSVSGNIAGGAGSAILSFLNVPSSIVLTETGAGTLHGKQGTSSISLGGIFNNMNTLYVNGSIYSTPTPAPTPAPTNTTAQTSAISSVISQSTNIVVNIGLPTNNQPTVVSSGATSSSGPLLSTPLSNSINNNISVVTDDQQTLYNTQMNKQTVSTGGMCGVRS